MWRGCLFLWSLALFGMLTAGCQPATTSPAKQNQSRVSGKTPDRRPSRGPVSNEGVERKQAERIQTDQATWGNEVAAQHYGSWLVKLWDNLRADSDDPVATLARQFSGRLTIPDVVASHQLSWGVLAYRNVTSRHAHSAAQWQALLRRWIDEGYRLVQSEWHHERFDTSGPRAVSDVHAILHIARLQPETRAIVDLRIRIEWGANGTGEASLVMPQQIDIETLTILRRDGRPGFVLAATLSSRHPTTNDFLAVVDLDHDGSSEIVFDHQRYRHLGNGEYAGSPLVSNDSLPLTCALFADFDGDHRIDLLRCRRHQVPELFRGDGTRFTGPAARITAVPPLDFPMVVTGGDVNGDGTVDVWIGQYKPPYEQGQMPTPYFDANDGFPAYLLINDGTGAFRNETIERGLAAQRHRRTYGASLIDWDADRDLDLIVVSDFAGLDLYRNNGVGEFTDVTHDLVQQPHNFGMSHRVDDFNRDGYLDLYVTGMSSTTARRLDAMDAHDARFPQRDRMRPVMGFGNRMYLQQGNRFVEPPVDDTLTRTGWSWGVSSSDFDNDGRRDLYVANGHVSGPSVADYCSTFWRHDIYAATSQPDSVWEALFREEHDQFQQIGSWNGYEHNALLMQDSDGQFHNVAFLMGVALEFDARAVLTHDIDQDGQIDLLVVENPRGSPARLHVYRNQLVNTNHWIRVVLSDAPYSPLGARVVVRMADEPDRVATVVAGDSFTSQHPAELHFGLGATQRIDEVRVIWPSSTTPDAVQNDVAADQTIRF